MSEKEDIALKMLRIKNQSLTKFNIAVDTNTQLINLRHSLTGYPLQEEFVIYLEIVIQSLFNRQRKKLNLIGDSDSSPSFQVWSSC